MEIPSRHSHAPVASADPASPGPRDITRSGNQVRGIFTSVRFDRAMLWRSRLGCDLMYRLEASWLISDAHTQTEVMQVKRHDGESFRYAAHAAAVARDGRLICIECAWSQSLRSSHSLARHHAIAQHLHARGVHFRVVTELQLEAPHVRNASRALVQALRDRRAAEQDEKDLMCLTRSRPATFSELHSLLGASSAMRMLALGNVYFNTHERLGATTSLSYVYQENFDAADFVLAA